jgi:putative membrane protein
MKHLTPKDFESVKQAVIDVEALSRGEIVPLVIAQASDYRWVRYRTAWIGFILVLLFAEVWSVIRAWPLDAAEVILFGLAGAIAGGLLSSVPAVARLAIGDKRIASDVHLRALAEFTRQGCASTRERTGILVMVSLLEHRIEIIADEGIQKHAVAKEGPEVWQRICSDFARSAKEGNAVEGLITVIRRLGALLGQHFPSDGKDKDEISNHLRTGK